MAARASGLETLLEQHKDDFEVLPSGRLRCIPTGHEMAPSSEALAAHLGNKRYRALLLERRLKQFEPHVRQSPDHPDKLLCTLTGVLLQKTEDAVWKHMMGKKFQKALEAKEAQRGLAQRSSQDGTMNSEMAGADDVMNERKVTKSKWRTGEIAVPGAVHEAAREKRMGGKGVKGGRDESKGMTTDTRIADEEVDGEVEFWMPSPGYRWDNDNGGDRWADEERCAEDTSKSATMNGKAHRHGNLRDDVEMNEGKDHTEDESDEDFFGRRPSREKREARMAVGGRFNAPPKKKGRPK